MRVDAVLLAAGAASRMGRPKHLIPIEGVPMLVRIAEALRGSAVREVVVVLRRGDEQGRAVLDSLGVRVVEPESPEEGRAASVRAGLAALSPGAEGVLFALADQPFLEPGDFDALIERFARGDVGIVYATYEGARGTPVLFGAAYRGELEQLRGSQGGRAVIVRNAEDAVGVPLPPERGRDLDCPEDLPGPR